MLSQRASAILVLLAIKILAIWTMGIQTLENGLHAKMTLLRDFGPHFLPGSNIPLKETYVGIQSVDYALTVLQCVFANVVDGSSLGLSLFAFHFSGAFLAAITVVWTEDFELRSSIWSQVTAASWCLAMQAGYGVVMPIYCITRLSLTPKARAKSMRPISSSLVTPAIELNSLWISICFGYILPSVLMCWRTENYELHQTLVAIWQVFPTWILVSQLILSRIPMNFRSSSHYRTPQQELDKIHIYGQLIAASIHGVAIGAVAVAYFLPFLLDPAMANALQPQKVFIPPRFWNPDPVDSIAHGVLVIFQWDHYIGTAAMLIWLWLSNIEACEIASSDQPRLLAILSKTILLGPGAVAISLLAQKDRISRMAVEKSSLAQKKTCAY